MNAGAMGSATFRDHRVSAHDGFLGKYFRARPGGIESRISLLPGVKKEHCAFSGLSRATRLSGIGRDAAWPSSVKSAGPRNLPRPAPAVFLRIRYTIPAGKLVDALGLKGTRVGGAMVSMEHGNFIVNNSKATAAEVLQLIEQIKAKARDERGIELRTEVEIVGE